MFFHFVEKTSCGEKNLLSEKKNLFQLSFTEEKKSFSSFSGKKIFFQIKSYGNKVRIWGNIF